MAQCCPKYTLIFLNCPLNLAVMKCGYSFLQPRLPSSDHRRAVRPKLRQKASASHLKMLHQRKDVSSSIGNNQEEEEIDPNTYSTYMGKYVA